jgi:Flp pilus assembly protein TadD
MSEFARAVQLAPDSARYAYVYAIALNSAGRTREALTAIERAAQALSTPTQTIARRARCWSNSSSAWAC